MGSIDYLGRSEWNDFLREWREFKNQSPLANSAIDRGALRVLSAEGLIVEGSQRVSGVLIVSGEETVDGILRVTGTLIVSGETEISGTTEITGPTTITGTFGIDGDTTLSGTLTLNGGEIVIAGDTPIRLGTNSAGLAVMTFGSSEIRGADNGIILDPGTGAAITTGSSGVRIFLLPDAPAGATPNVHINSLGYLSVIR
jgi:cytoskeletal protein CcmA (bactofilin family)